MSARAPVIVLIAGGSCSGKTTLARHLCETLGALHPALVLEDAYYLSAAQRGPGNVTTYNFDRPETKDFALLTAHMGQVKAGEAFDVPDYDFVTHDRLPMATRVRPQSLVILEGLHNLLFPSLRALADLTVFVEAHADVRRRRRIARDVAERGREAEATARQFDAVVEPMHRLYVEPQQALAQHVISNSEDSEHALALAARLLADRVQGLIGG